MFFGFLCEIIKDFSHLGSPDVTAADYVSTNLHYYRAMALDWRGKCYRMLYDQAESICCLHVSVVYCANTIDVSFGNCGNVLNTSNGLCGATVSVTDRCVHTRCPPKRGIRSAVSCGNISNRVNVC